jgi:hypothetical protein
MTKNWVNNFVEKFTVEDEQSNITYKAKIDNKEISFKLLKFKEGLDPEDVVVFIKSINNKEGLEKAKKEEREACIEKIKCWYDTTDTDPDIEEIVNLLQDDYLDPWKKKLKQIKTN